MASAVVRCPGCRGASRVAVDSLGHRVACPRCPATFIAREEEAPRRESRRRKARANESAPSPNEPRPAKVIPIAPPRTVLTRTGTVPIADPAAPDAKHDPDHDPHLP